MGRRLFPKSRRLRRAALATGALVLSTLSALLVHVWEYEQGQFEVERRTQEIAATLRTGLATPVESLYALQSFLQVPRDGGISLAQFRDFTASAIARHPEIAGLEWFPLVAASERAAFERSIGLEQPGYRIVEPTRAGSMVEAVGRPLHIPLAYMHPFVPAVAGLDLAFDPLRVEPVERALETGLVTLSDRFQLVEDPPGIMSVAAYAPLTAATWLDPKVGGPLFQRGVAVALFRINPLVQQLLGEQHTEGLSFEIWDLAGATDAQLIHQSGVLTDPERTHAAEISFVDRSYRLLVAPAKPYFAWASLLAFLVTAGMCAMVIAYLDARQRARRLLRRAERLGQYQVEGRVASGGMGTVYRARHALLRRPTAIKIANEDQVAASFEKEVLLTSQLTHPNTIMVYDFGRGDNGSFYYAMEYVDGYDLEEFVQRFGPMPAARAIRLLLQAAGSLAEAHDKGLVHRDIKPSNLMVTERGGVKDFVKVLDFGLAKPQIASDSKTGPVSTAFAGTPGYVAPEVIAGQASTPASDIFSLGAVGYHLVMGRSPFHAAASVTEALTLALTTTPALAPSVPQAFAKLITECLSREPRARPRSMQALAERLKLALADCAQWTAADAERWWQAHPRRETAVHRSSMQTFLPKVQGLSSSSTEPDT